MRFPKALLCSLVSTSMTIATAPPALAQSFFQKLFGFSSPQPAPVMRAPKTIPSHRFYRAAPRPVERSVEEDADEDIGPPDSGGPYKTICVRACDGYYFPLRHNAWHKNFGPDAKSCRLACGEQARLYYYPLEGGSIDTMVDLAGQPYSEMKTAFAYRKKLVSGCACKPPPWSYEEAARHRRYREQEAALNQSRMEPTGVENSTATSVGDNVAEGTDGTAPQELLVAETEDAGDRSQARVQVQGAKVSSHRIADFARPPHKRRRPRSPTHDSKNTPYQPIFSFSFFGLSKTN